MAKPKRISNNLSTNSTDKKKAVKEPSLPPTTKKEFNKILDTVHAINSTLANTLYMCALTGLRYSDCVVLTLSDFLDESGQPKSKFIVVQQKVYNMIYTRKVNNGVDAHTAHTDARIKAKVTIYINKAIINLISDIILLNPNIGRDDLIFANKHKSSKGYPLDIRSANKILRRVKAELKLDYPLGTHSFRKYLALNLLKNKANVAEIRDLLGHNHLNSTNSYLHSFSGELKNLIGKLDY